MQAEVSEASRAIDGPEDRALRAAASIARPPTSEIGSASAPRPAGTAAVKNDVSVLKADVAALKSDVATPDVDVNTPKDDVTKTKIGVTRIDGKLALLRWRPGFGLAVLVAITVKLFLQ